MRSLFICAVADRDACNAAAQEIDHEGGQHDGAGDQALLFASINGSTTAARAGLFKRSTNIHQAGGRRLDADGFQSADGAAQGTGFILSTAVFDWENAVLSLYKNGTLDGQDDPFQTAGNTPDTAAAHFRLGALGNETFDLNGDISELIVFVPALDATDLNHINEYFYDRSALPITFTATTLTIAASYAGTTLQGISDWSEETIKKTSSLEVPRGAGSLRKTADRRTAKRYTLTGRFFGDTIRETEDYFTSIRNLQNSETAQNLILYDDGRYTPAFMRGMTQQPAGGNPRVVDYTIEFESVDPFLYYPVEEYQYMTLAVSPAEFVLWNGGKAACPVRFEFTATGGNRANQKLTHLDTGESILYGGTVLENKTLVINGKTGAVTNDGLSDPDIIGAPFDLAPGVNNIRYEGDVTGTLNAYWTRRY